MRISRLHEPVERTLHWHVTEMPPLRLLQPPAHSQHDYLAQLPPAHLVTRLERPVLIPSDNPMRICRLHKRIEYVISRHVTKMPYRWLHYRPPTSQHYYLGQLPTSGAVPRQEAISIAGDDVMAIQVAYCLVKRIVSRHIRKVH